MNRTAALAAALSLTLPFPLAAQLSLRLGGVRSRYADRPAVSAVSFSPRFEWSDAGARAAVDAGYSAFEGGGWAGQAGFQADESRRLGPVAALAITGSVNGNWLDGGTSSWRGRLGAQLGRRVGPVTLGAGAGGGGIRSVSGRTFGTYDLLAAATLDLATLRVARTVADSLHYTDVALQLGRRSGRLALDATGGLRRVDGAATTGNWQAVAAYGVTSAVAMDLSAGRSAPTPDGFAGGLYVSGGARVRLGRAPGRSSRLVERINADEVRIRVRVPRAERVAIAGDWNGWAQVPMTRDGDDWVVTLPLASGAHEFGISVDGGRITVPGGVPTVKDEFGGTVGILMVR